MSLIMKRRARSHGSKKDLMTEKNTMVDKLGVTTQVDAACPICQEPIGFTNPEGITEGWSLLPCGHRFGSYCIKHYLNVAAENRPSCPVCRQIAYHSCGHPVLPVLLKPNGSTADKIVESADLLIEEMKLSTCAYCQSHKSGGRIRLVPPAVTTRIERPRGLKWRSLVGWIRILSFSRRRRAARRNRTQNVPDLPPQEQPAQDQADSSEENRDPPPADPLDHLPSLSSRAQPSSQAQEAGGWTGPWVDPWPKPRDHEWEKWWKSQEPQEK